MAVIPTPGGRHFRRRALAPAAPGRRTLAAATSVLGVLSLGVFAGAAYTASPPTGIVRAAAASASTRLSGSDRFGTAAAVSAGTFSPGVPVAYLATGSDFADALTAAAAAGGKGPVLLAGAATLPAVTAQELARLHPTRVVVVGGRTAIGDGVVAALASLLPSSVVTRTTGIDRYATAAALSATTFPTGASIAYIATGSDYPDALAAAAATAGHGPVLLTRTWSVPSSTIAELRRLHVAKIVVVGGSGAVSDATFLAIAAAVPSAPMSRIAGDDRYGTAAAVASGAFGTGTTASIVYLATGQNFPDALAAAAAAGGHGPVLLVGGQSVPGATSAALRSLAPTQIVLVGGLSAVSAATESQVRASAASTAVPVSVKAAVAVEAARAELGKPYHWAGAGPESFDCSGLTMVAWRAAGVTLPHNAAGQATMIPAVPLANVAPGDLIFYGNPDIYHVGIYIGGGQMIEAAHSGTLVRIADIHRPDLLGAGRPG